MLDGGFDVIMTQIAQQVRHDKDATGAVAVMT
jgi:hypothetical protein